MRRFVLAAGVLAAGIAAGLIMQAAIGRGDTQTITAGPGDVVLVDCGAARAYPSRASLNIGRVVCSLPPTATETSTPTASAPADTSTPTSTETPTPTPTSALPTSTVAPSPSATPTSTSPAGDACSQNPDCGTPRFFCDTWQGGWCNDYESTVGPVVFETPFDTIANQVSFDCLDTGTPSYLPSMLGGSLPGGCRLFGRYSHVMGIMESGGFGDALMRFHRPVNIPATGERHIHLETDFKPFNTRNYVRIMLSPDLTKRDADDRGGQAYPRSFIQAWFRNGYIEGSICRAGVCEGDSYPWGDAFGSSWPAYPQADNVRVPIDIYISQTSIRIFAGTRLMVNENFAPLGFDTAYLYASQVSYNPCDKDGRCAPADHVAHWDAFAVSGPTLPVNGLTPRGYKDVVWNSYGAASCSIAGYPAVYQSNGSPAGWTWVTWVARVPNSVTPTRAMISCVPGNGYSLAAEQHRGFEVVVPE